MNTNKILICGGGTGGHFFSGLSLAELYLKKYPEAEVHFVGTRLGIEAHHKFTDDRMEMHFIHARGVKGKSIFSKLWGLFSISFGVFESFMLVFHLKPQVVFGVGGYASAPTLVAALVCRFIGKWKVILLEQNFVAGMTNEYLKKYADHAYSGFETPGFDVVDLPLRQSALRKAQKARQPEWPPKKIFVFGGSQGAVGLNTRWCEILPDLKREHPEISIIHQAGSKDVKKVKGVYKDLEIDAKVFDFSSDMPSFYEAADLIICRAGAMTVFEVMAFQRPAIFIPYPYATENHQTKNALALQSKDWVIQESDFNWERLKALLNSPQASLLSRKTPVSAEWEQILEDLVG
jgi:UDP-N-acetylglucosamine--N-acetylmuramyl-(pentapeptide) pyrophosphoryl-undecaprenol N-acetylglucosamine transferase